MSIVALPQPAGVDVSDRQQLQVVRMTGSPAAIPSAPYEVVALHEDTAAVVRSIDSWLRPAAARVCRQAPEPGRASPCGSVRPFPPSPVNRDTGLFMTWAYPRLQALNLPPPYIARYEIPLLPVAGETRDFALAESEFEGCPWAITRVEGLEAEGTLPGWHVRLRSTTGAAGLLVVEKGIGMPACPSEVFDPGYPPCLFEVRPGDPLGRLAGVG